MWNPKACLKQAGDKLGFVKRTGFLGDLERFKHFIEQRGVETGGWRGEVEGPGGNQ